MRIRGSRSQSGPETSARFIPPPTSWAFSRGSGSHWRPVKGATRSNRSQKGGGAALLMVSMIWRFRARESEATGAEGRCPDLVPTGPDIIHPGGRTKQEMQCTRWWPVSDRLSSGLVVEHCWGGEAGWKYPPLERAKDTQLLRAKTKRKRDGWMDGLCHGEAASESGIRCQLQGWCMGSLTSHHTTPCIVQPLCPPFLCIR